MSATWMGDPPPRAPRLGAGGVLRVLMRGLPLALLVFGGLALTLLVRLIERPVWGVNRPLTPAITVAVCRGALRIIGLSVETQGTPMATPGAVVANHASWLDIFVLNAPQRVYFVSKAEVAGWPGIGWLARATGTVFIARDRAQAAAQAALFQSRLRAGHRLLFFPEGTSSDGQRVLPFKSTLFAAFFAPGLRERLAVQPVSVRYRAPEGCGARFYGWWGDMEFGPHLLRVLAAPRQGRVTVVYHAPLAVAAAGDRKTLAAACETRVRTGFGAPRPGSVKEG
ncbi:lysophospholipid acyltransferase family protein [uncultured Roseobacter sp.]|uniref:lysophospholipid acyltransferase family protein n=1 Tax=uncultured Roseobacter sp. TaxID=114847 RepID=UPI00262D4475|nr:lysophospholipid acyltransferase family protein [uncultured Roseobacter sp.]